MASQLKDHSDFQRGLGTELAPTYRDTIAADSKAVPEILKLDHSPPLGTAHIPASRYVSMEAHREEVEKVWKKTWQVACREEEIPDVGDHFNYDVAGMSFIVVRTAPDRVRAFWNVCLHRGRRLVDQSGKASCEFKCSYHGWTWDISGALKTLPGKWDFPDVAMGSHNLREVQVSTWGGFVFINPDPSAGPIEEHLGAMPAHFSTWPLEDRFTVWHLRKVIRSNWKIAMEAFLEGYHMAETHPQALPSVADHANQYDYWDDGASAFSRLLSPVGMPSINAQNGSKEEALIEIWALLNALRRDQVDALPADIHDRATLAGWRRKTLSAATGADYERLPDTMMLDSIQYWLWPNFCPWLGEGLPLTYLFRPDQDSPDTCYMDVWMLIRKPDGAKAPPAASITELGPDDRFEPLIGALGEIFDQDDSNMPRVHDGLKGWPDDVNGCTVARYQESRIRFFHEVLDKKLRS